MTGREYMQRQKEVATNDSVYYEAESDKVTGFCLLGFCIICNLNNIVNIVIVFSTLSILLHLEIEICQML